MICSIKSNNSKCYNTVSFNIDIPWKCSYVKYYVSSINTTGNILLTTSDDFIEYNDGGNHIINFENKFDYSINEIKNILNNESVFEVNIKERKLAIKPTKDVVIEKPSHRAALITGLYNTKFPLELKAGIEYIISDIPIIQHSKLYLVSLQGQAVYSSIGDKEYTPSVIANIDTMIIDNKPFIYNFEQQGKPIKIKTNTDSLKYLEMRLVDFCYEPIELQSPLFITLKIKPSNSSDIYDVLTK